MRICSGVAIRPTAASIVSFASRSQARASSRESPSGRPAPEDLRRQILRDCGYVIEALAD